MRCLSFALLFFWASSVAFGDTAADVKPFPFDQFSRMAEERDVSIDAPAKAVIREFADGLDSVPAEIESVVASLRDGENSANLKMLTSLLTHERGQAVSSAMAKHRDPIVRFLAGVVLSGSGNSNAAEAVHALLHEESISMTDKRMIRTWCDGIGIRAASDDADDILAHLTAAMSREPKLKKGHVAPHFTAVTDAGRKISSKQLANKVVLLHFWATSCGPCMGQMSSHIEKLSGYDAEDIEIIFVSLDDDEQAFKSALKEYGMPFNNIREPQGWGGAITRMFGVNSMPFDIIVGRDGKVVSNSINDLNAAIGHGAHSAVNEQAKQTNAVKPE